MFLSCGGLVATTQYLAKCGHAKAHGTFLDDRLTPDARDQLALADKLGGVIYKRDENVESAAANSDGMATALENSLGYSQPKRTE